MPVTPYHFGPSRFLGLLFRKWIDIPVFILANVIVDVEVLVGVVLGLDIPIPRYSHTLLIGAAVGALWGVAAYPLRSIFKKIMQIFRLPYQTSLRKMVISGILGAWLHVVIDGFYHFDVHVFWPNTTISLWQIAAPHISKRQIEIICIVFFIAAVVPYTIAVSSYIKQNKDRKQNLGKTQS